MKHRGILLLLVLVAVTPAAIADPTGWANLGPPRAVAGDGHLAPRFSPDGRELLVTGARFAGLAVVAVDGRGAPIDVAADEGAGVDGRFLADGSVAFSARRAGERRTMIADRSGNGRRFGGVRTAGAGEVSAPIAFARGDRIYVRRRSTLESVGTGDRFFGPVATSDGARVAFVGLATGIWIYELADGSLTHVGAGTAPSWSPDGRRLVFERTEDDGHEIVASDLWLHEVGRGLQRLTFTDDVLERRPAIGPDGASLAYDDDLGTIWIATLEVRP
ncbi:MAG: PD40 domain-containing protein [Deltaproteobacteria bacterium]|nr:PD40 domain-containing protein [Deltaproteobacteria bacterium]